MTTVATTPELPMAGPPGPHPGSARPTSLARVIHSEWIKLRTLRSNWLTLAGLFLAIVVFGLISAAVASGSVTTPDGGGPGFAGSSPVETVLAGANFAVLLMAVLGVLVGAREHSSGMIRTTLAAVPTRWPVLVGKLATFVAVVAPVTVAAVLVAFFGGTAILSGGGVESASWSDPGVAGQVLGTAGYLVGIGVMGGALGVLVRGIAAGLGTLIGGVLFVPTLLTALLPNDWDTVLKFLPSNAGAAFTGTATSSELLTSIQGAWVFTGWVALIVSAAVAALMTRDA
jgi:ABC-2 type transport system permease protein